VLQLLKAIWQSDGTFPSGSFAFSYGVEGLAAMGAVSDRDTLSDLTQTILQQRWAPFDRIALVQSFRARGDLAQIIRIDQEVEAATFGETQRDGSRRNGSSFLATHAKLGNVTAVVLRDAVRRGDALGHIAVMQGALWQSMEMDERMVQLASAYITVSGAMSAAVRLGVVGALQAQMVMNDCLPLIDRILVAPIPDDARLSSFVPFLDIAAAQQAQANLRLFAN
jgi:urease accessory protein